MTDLSPNPDPDSNGDPGVAAGVGSGTPRWVKVFGIIALVVVLLFATLMLTGVGRGPGGHGPGAHAPSGNAVPTTVSEDHIPPATVTEGHTSSGGDLGYRLPAGSDSSR